MGEGGSSTSWCSKDSEFQIHTHLVAASPWASDAFSPSLSLCISRLGMMILTFRGCPEVQRQRMTSTAQCPAQHGDKLPGGCLDDDDDDDNDDVAPHFQLAPLASLPASAVSSNHLHGVQQLRPLPRPAGARRSNRWSALLQTLSEVRPGEIEDQGQVSAPRQARPTSKGERILRR